MITDYKIFKAELGLYKHYLKQYKNCMNKSKEIIDSLASISSPLGVKTVEIKQRNKNGTITTKQVPLPKLDYDPFRAMKHRDEMFLLSNDLEQEAYSYKIKIDEIEETLNSLPLWLKTKAINTFVNGLGSKLAKENNESRTSFYRHLDEELMEWLKK